MSESTKLLLVVAIVGVLFGGLSLTAQTKTVTVSGMVIDLTCASKGKVAMNSWYNAENDDHHTQDGPKPGCATMCLKGGQPAALFSKGRVTAVFACNPRATLSNYAVKEVEVQGYWAGSSDDVKELVPQKIRAVGATEWEEVNCATMH